MPRPEGKAKLHHDTFLHTSTRLTSVLSSCVCWGLCAESFLRTPSHLLPHNTATSLKITKSTPATHDADPIWKGLFANPGFDGDGARQRPWPATACADCYSNEGLEARSLPFERLCTSPRD
jgi:hypothetical protein